jgi:hypothetical protein
MSTESREKLAKQQAALLQALLGDGATPDGFNDDRVQAASLSLRQKRERTAVTVRSPVRSTLLASLSSFCRRFFSHSHVFSHGKVTQWNPPR